MYVLLYLQTVEELFFPVGEGGQDTPSRKPTKRVLVSDQAQYIPAADGTHYYLKDEEIFTMAIKDIICLFGLKVNHGVFS